MSILYGVLIFAVGTFLAILASFGPMKWVLDAEDRGVLAHAIVWTWVMVVIVLWTGLSIWSYVLAVEGIGGY